MGIVEGAANSGGIVKLPGVDALMKDVSSFPSSVGGCLRSNPPQLSSGSTLPNPKWAVCTSATRKYATSALGAAGINIPDVFIVAEDVKHGKPA